MRDSGPIFRVNDADRRNVVGLNFNGWGNKQISNKDKFVAHRVAADVGLRFQAAAFVSEGGAIDCDGDGTLIAAESSIINLNRNPGKTKAQLEAAMCAAYGARKVLWVPGLVGQDITDDHIDATSRYVRPGVVLVQHSLVDHFCRVPRLFPFDVWPPRTALKDTVDKVTSQLSLED